MRHPQFDPSELQPVASALSLVTTTNDPSSDTDVAEEEAVIGAVTETKPRARAPKHGFRFQSYTPDQLPREGDGVFLIEGMLPFGGLAEVHGPPGVGKSFLTIDLALSIAEGLPFLGRQTMQAAVLYVASERFGGFGNRVAAWGIHHERPSVSNLHVMRDSVQLLDDRDVDGFIVAVKKLNPAPSLIVLDTLSRSLVGGDENGAHDMTKAIAALDCIRRETSAAILLVHHTRKAGDMERGSTVLRGAADIMMALRKDRDGVVLTAEKVNDFAPFPDCPLRLVSVGGGCVVLPAPAADPATSEKALPKKLITCLRALLKQSKALSLEEWGEAAGLPSSSLGRWCKTTLEPRGYVERASSGRGGYLLTEQGRQAAN